MTKINNIETTNSLGVGFEHERSRGADLLARCFDNLSLAGQEGEGNGGVFSLLGGRREVAGSQIVLVTGSVNTGLMMDEIILRYGSQRQSKYGPRGLRKIIDQGLLTVKSVYINEDREMLSRKVLNKVKARLRDFSLDGNTHKPGERGSTRPVRLVMCPDVLRVLDIPNGIGASLGGELRSSLITAVFSRQSTFMSDKIFSVYEMARDYSKLIPITAQNFYARCHPVAGN